MVCPHLSPALELGESSAPGLLSGSQVTDLHHTGLWWHGKSCGLFTRDDFAQGYWTLAHNSRDAFSSLLGKNMWENAQFPWKGERRREKESLQVSTSHSLFSFLTSSGVQAPSFRANIISTVLLSLIPPYYIVRAEPRILHSLVGTGISWLYSIGQKLYPVELIPVGDKLKVF